MTSTKQHTVIAAFRNGTDAQAAADELAAQGFSHDEIFLENGSTAGKSPRPRNNAHEGGIKGWFKSIFGEEDDKDRSGYESAFEQGHSLLRVDISDDQIATVEAILNRHSPVDVHTSDDHSVGSAKGTGPVPSRSTEGAIPVVREEVQIGKRQVLRGGVRVYSRLVNEPVEEKISLRQETVRVDRRPVDRAATEADLRAVRDEVIEVREFAEEPVIAKQSRVVEEVRLGKDVSERRETIRDTVRHTEINVERTPQGTGTVTDDSDFRSDFQNRYGNAGGSYESYQPAYQYGYTMASTPEYEGRSYEEVEPNLEVDYRQRYPGSAWEKMKASVRFGWNKAANKTRAAVR